MILKLNLKLEIRKKCVMTRVVCVFWILKQIVLRQTDTSFEVGRGECTVAPLNCIQVEGRGGEGCIPNTEPGFRDTVHVSFFKLVCVGLEV